LIVATRRYFKRVDNTWIKFTKNYAVLIKKEGEKTITKEPVGTRLFVPLLSEFEKWGFKKLFSMAPEVL
jgi:ribosomal protein L14